MVSITFFQRLETFLFYTAFIPIYDSKKMPRSVTSVKDSDDDLEPKGGSYYLVFLFDLYAHEIKKTPADCYRSSRHRELCYLFAIVVINYAVVRLYRDLSFVFFFFSYLVFASLGDCCYSC